MYRHNFIIINELSTCLNKGQPTYLPCIIVYVTFFFLSNLIINLFLKTMSQSDYKKTPMLLKHNAQTSCFRQFWAEM